MQDERTKRLEEAPLPQLLLHYAVPAIVGTMVVALYNLVDRIFIGQTEGAYAMAGLALTFPILIFLQAFGMLVGAGASTRISILLGQQDREGAKAILGSAIILTAVFSISTALITLYFLDDFLVIFGGSAESIPFARRYLLITVPGNIFSVLAMGYNAMMRASGYPRKAMYTMLIGAILNIILDYVFVYPLGMGIEGVAWATVISMFASACFVMWHFFDRDSLVHFDRGHIKFSAQSMWAIISIGLSPFAVQLLGAVSNGLINRGFVESAATQAEADMAIGAMGIINSYAMIGFFLMLGIAQAMQPIVGYNHGAGQHRRVYDTVLLTGTISALIGVVFTIGAQLFSAPVTDLFTIDPELKAASMNAFKLCLYALGFVGTQIIATQFFQSIGHARKSFVLSVSRQVLFLIPLLLVMPGLMGVDGVWLSLPISDALSGVLGLALVYYYFRQQGVTGSATT